MTPEANQDSVLCGFGLIRSALNRRKDKSMLDYHVHTPLCKHATGRPAAMVQAAFDAGLKEIAFLDHLTLPPLPTNHSMAAKDIPFYLNCIRELAVAWEGKIRVLAGLEIDYHLESLEEILRITQSYDLDMVAGSVHFVQGYNIASRSRRNSWSHLPPLPLFHTYIDAMEAMVEADFCDIICHLDLMDKFAPSLSPEERKETDNRMEKLLDAVSQKKLVVEINGSGLDQPMGRPYPSDFLLSACKARNIPVTLASDAHSPDSVGKHAETLLGHIRAAGYNSVTGFYRREPRTMSIT
ncbi:histidinol-phosphatase [Desulfobotulus mexicanus]|uniref:Histidinol-phosphatase n=2 Tax=Desulfobotulus mexicanus TaxID=2586642 RepID=A0A5Q4VAF6_9BACT|nr:histidinol-phosphatase [Desulfobotulus mexicanus]